MTIFEASEHLKLKLDFFTRHMPKDGHPICMKNAENEILAHKMAIAALVIVGKNTGIVKKKRGK